MYKITMYEDENTEKDMLLLNLVPTDWETDISESVCTINLPKEADLSKAQVFSGPYGTEGNDVGAVLETSDDGKTITITAENIPAHNGVTLMLELPQGYWVGAREFGKLNFFDIILFALGPIGAIVLWYLYGRDDHMTKTVEFYPPDGLTPGEIGYILDGNADQKDLISTIVYMADKGYLMIEENGKRILISGCSHRGAVNIEEHFQPDVFIGGFHFSKLEDEKLRELAQMLDTRDTAYYTCHCTGVQQYEHMKKRMSMLKYISAGQSIEL